MICVLLVAVFVVWTVQQVVSSPRFSDVERGTRR